jgi:hypothetical protein
MALEPVPFVEPHSRTPPWLTGTFVVAEKINKTNVTTVIYLVEHSDKLHHQQQQSLLVPSNSDKLQMRQKTSPLSKWETENFLQALTPGNFHKSRIGFQPEAANMSFSNINEPLLPAKG